MSIILALIIGLLCISLLILVGLFVYAISIYNGLVKLKTLVEEAWSKIDVELKNRYDLIPNLVETVKGYASQEEEVFKGVTELRSQAMQAETPSEKARYEGELTNTLKSLFAVSENYPDLKSNQNFLSLQQTLEMIEDDIAKSRDYYNGSVREFNIKIKTFPVNIFAGMLGFEEQDFFKILETERENVKVSFSEEDSQDEKQ